MNDKPKRYSMLYGVYDEALDKKAAEDYAKEQYLLGKKENAIQTAKRLLKKLPDWTDERIAGLVPDITSDDVAQLRQGKNQFKS